MEDINLVMVEDDPMVMEVNKGFIEQTGGFTIKGTATTGREGLTLIKAIRPQLVVLDIYLPDISGIRVLKDIRRQGLPTDVIMVTAAHDVDTVQSLVRFGVIDYIIKPFKFIRLKAALDKYKMYQGKIRLGGAIAQEELDDLIKAAPQTGETGSNDFAELPKGLREITLQQILNCLTASEHGLSAEEVAIAVGLARVTARRYLEFLEKTGKAHLETQYGTVGRPVNRYRLS